MVELSVVKRMRSKNWKPRRIFFRGFPLRVFILLYPKPKLRSFLPRHFDQTPRPFPTDEFSILHYTQNRKVGDGNPGVMST